MRDHEIHLEAQILDSGFQTTTANLTTSPLFLESLVSFEMHDLHQVTEKNMKTQI